jgi:hypothetical protein
VGVDHQPVQRQRLHAARLLPDLVETAAGHHGGGQWPGGAGVLLHPDCAVPVRAPSAPPGAPRHLHDVQRLHLCLRHDPHHGHRQHLVPAVPAGRGDHGGYRRRLHRHRDHALAHGAGGQRRDRPAGGAAGGPRRRQRPAERGDGRPGPAQPRAGAERAALPPGAGGRADRPGDRGAGRPVPGEQPGVLQHDRLQRGRAARHEFPADHSPGRSHRRSAQRAAAAWGQAVFLQHGEALYPP